MGDEKTNIWKNILIFFASEWFGQEFLQEFLAYKFDGEPPVEGETPINIDLFEYEKMFWNFVDCLHYYLRKHRKRLPSGELEEKTKMASGFKAQFWAMVQLNHPEAMDADNIGIRGNYRIVACAMTEHPMMQILKGVVPG